MSAQGDLEMFFAGKADEGGRCGSVLLYDDTARYARAYLCLARLHYSIIQLVRHGKDHSFSSNTFNISTGNKRFSEVKKNDVLQHPGFILSAGHGRLSEHKHADCLFDEGSKFTDGMQVHPTNTGQCNMHLCYSDDQPKMYNCTIQQGKSILNVGLTVDKKNTTACSAGNTLKHGGVILLLAFVLPLLSGML
ncbi:hypothetical protein AMELA_G00254650 [Ameiurus melas]|uniref:Uncharacterized protein n=1 Tax=Ameiurus melas TaxID=219545 RepID=A0A7J5ZT06_AMEME|nr:hypothetical protein AMELA_G00254650 [Ameiurus melas]